MIAVIFVCGLIGALFLAPRLTETTTVPVLGMLLGVTVSGMVAQGMVDAYGARQVRLRRVAEAEARGEFPGQDEPPVPVVSSTPAEVALIKAEGRHLTADRHGRKDDDA